MPVLTVSRTINTIVRFPSISDTDDMDMGECLLNNTDADCTGVECRDCYFSLGVYIGLSDVSD